MRSVLLAGAVLLLACVPATGCDVCGGSGGNSFSGILPNYTRHFVGVRYWQRSFTSTHDVLFAGETPRITREEYRSAEWWARLYPHHRVQLLIALPAHDFRQRDGASVHRVTGVGDLRLQAGWIAIQPSDTALTWNHTLVLSGGVKMPTGNNGFTDPEGVRLDENMQAGSGSWDALFSASYLVRRKAWALQSELSYQRNGTNRYQFRFGERLSLSSQVLWWKEFNADWTLLPAAGFTFQYAGADSERVRSRTTENVLSGGIQTNLLVSATTMYRNWSFGIQWSRPTWSDLADGHIIPYDQWQCSLVRFISRKKITRSV